MSDQRMFTEKDAMALSEAISRVTGGLLVTPLLAQKRELILDFDARAMAYGVDEARTKILKDCAYKLTRLQDLYSARDPFFGELDEIIHLLAVGEPVNDVIEVYQSCVADLPPDLT